MKVLQSGTWKEATPKGVLQGGVWKTPQAMHVLQNGVWKKVWPTEPVLPNQKVEIVAHGDLTSLPAHQPGDILVAFAPSTTSTTPPGKPAAGGTVPEWNDALANTGSANGTKYAAWRVCWALATTSSHTSGTWSGMAGAGYCVVCRNADQTNPIGGTGQDNRSGTNTPTAPNITLKNADNSSQLLNAILFNTGTSTSFKTVPSSHTQLSPTSPGTSGKIVVSKNDTNTGTGVTIQASSIVSTFCGVSVEIVSAGPAPEGEPEPPYLYDVAITYQGNHVVDFTALSGFVHNPSEEAYMFRCEEIPSLNGYVGKNFTKTFPVTAYSKFNCSLQDVSGDIPVVDAKTIVFTVDNR